MKLKKLLVPVILVSMLFTGCEKPISSESHKEKVTLEYVDYEPSHYQPLYINKHWIPHYTDDEYTVEVKYKDESQYFADEESYNLVKDKKIGSKVNAIVTEYKYEDGAVTYKINEIVK